MTEMNNASLCSTEISETTITKSVWKLRRYGRLLPANKNDCTNTSWKVYDSKESEDEIAVCILDSGHFLVSQAEELLEGFSLINAASFLKVQKKADVLLFQATLKGESRIFRVQFDGASRPEAIEECERAVLRLQDFLPVGSQEKPAPSSSSSTQLPLQAEQAGSAEATLEVQGSLPLKRLSQHFLGEGSLSLPLLYQASSPLAPADLELLRLCLLDPAFPAFVEEVEGELRKLCQE
ncbi:meiotic recombination protein REC114 [Alosa sapidissima]|uniref:meiotic recombination protein REC114 n=1 Tax=Alosa sapidissima TaxID=34773 RepID=UPI001C09871C|nr:meiotic recombination protein REC114 [Alosa sapidissima]